MSLFLPSSRALACFPTATVSHPTKHLHPFFRLRGIFQSRSPSFRTASPWPSSFHRFSTMAAEHAEFKDKVCVVVGAGPALGGNIGSLFAERGLRVILMARHEDSCAEHLKRIEKAGGNGAFQACDVTSPESVKTAFEEVRKSFGPVDCLVYNVGNIQNFGTPIMELTEEDFLRDFNLNTLGTLRCAQQVIPDMEAAKRGTILVTSATGAFRGSAALPAFSVAKFSQRGLTQSLAKQYAKKGIHVGLVRIDCMIDTPATRERLGDKFDPENFGNPEEIAKVYWNLYVQHRSAWSNEVDVRPYTEDWTF